MLQRADTQRRKEIQKESNRGKPKGGVKERRGFGFGAVAVGREQQLSTESQMRKMEN